MKLSSLFSLPSCNSFFALCRRASTVLICLSWTLYAGSSLAQPVNAYFNPETIEDGDEIELVVEYGTTSQPVNNITSVHFEIGFEGFTVDPASNPYLECGSSSWFGSDGNWAGTYEIDNNELLIIIDLWRTDEVPVSGHGFLVRMRGIIAEVDEIHFKRKPWAGVSGLKAIHQDANLMRIITREGQLELHSADEIVSATLFTLHGQEIQPLQLNAPNELGHLPAQIYLIRYQGQLGMGYRKIRWQPE